MLARNQSTRVPGFRLYPGLEFAACLCLDAFNAGQVVTVQFLYPALQFLPVSRAGFHKHRAFAFVAEPAFPPVQRCAREDIGAGDEPFVEQRFCDFTRLGFVFARCVDDYRWTSLF